MLLHQLAERAAGAERAGDWSQARARFAELFQRACARGEIAMAADALRGEARACRHLERFDEADELAELSRQIAEINGLPREAARAVNLQAVHLFVERNWGAARQLFQVALERARDVGDDELIGYVCQNLGVISNILGDLREARLFYLESIGAAIRSRKEASQAMVYNNLGMVCADLEEWMESQLYFERGIEIAERLNDREQIAKLYANRAEPLIHMGELEQASASLDLAEQVAEQINGRLTLIDIARYRGMLARLSGDLAAAEEHLARALRLAERGGLQLERAEVLEELACLRLAQATEALQQAHDLFASLGAVRDTARVAALLQAQVAAAPAPARDPREAPTELFLQPV